VTGAGRYSVLPICCPNVRFSAASNASSCPRVNSAPRVQVQVAASLAGKEKRGIEARGQPVEGVLDALPQRDDPQ
jgi:hypothetical protein